MTAPSFASLLKHSPHKTGTDQSVHGRRSYHLTDNPRFELDPTYVPDQNYLAIYIREDAGIYLTDNPEYWVNAHNYVRPFVVEFEVAGDQEHAGVPGSSQEFIPADQYDRLKVTRIIPLDEWVRERFGEKGWVEEHFNPSEYSIHEPYKRPFPDYKYTGPDVRDMSEAETQKLTDRAKQYLKEARGIDLDEEIEKHATHDQDDHGNRYPSKASYYQDRSTDLWHLVGHETSKPKKGREPTLCGLDTTDMRAGADFPSGDKRQAVFTTKGCAECTRIVAEADEYINKHMGPGPHPSGTPQSVHGSGTHGTSGTKMKQRVGPGGDLSEGFTILPITGEPATSGFAVAIKGNEKRIPGDEITPDLIAAFRRESWDLFSDIEGAHWGGWYDTKNDVYVFDVSVVLDDAEEAVKLGRENDQDAIFDLTNFEEIRTDDDGTSFEEWKARHS